MLYVHIFHVVNIEINNIYIEIYSICMGDVASLKLLVFEAITYHSLTNKRRQIFWRWPRANFFNETRGTLDFFITYQLRTFKH